MKRRHVLIAASTLSILGVFFVLFKPTPTFVRHEVPERSSQRSPASFEEGTTSQPAALSIRAPAAAIESLKVSEGQIQLMEQNLSELQKDVSFFKDSQAWVVHVHNPSDMVTALGLRDNESFSFKQIQELKSQPGLEPLVSRLEAIFYQLQK